MVLPLASLSLRLLGATFAADNEISAIASVTAFNAIGSSAPFTGDLAHRVLGYGSTEEVYDAGAKIGATFASESIKRVMQVFTSFWGCSESFVDVLRRAFNCEVFFGVPSPFAINNWVKERTQGKIDGIVPEDADIIRTTISTFYYKAKWEHEFDPALTSENTFYAYNDESKKHDVQMMESNFEQFPYYQDEDVQVVSLPYKGGDFDAVIVLPNEGKKLAKEFMTEEKYVQWTSGLKKDKNVLIRLPKFELDTGAVDFTDAIAGLAGPSVEVSEDLKLLQRCIVKVTEEGTEAVAVFAAELDGMAMPDDDDIEVDVNRPFMFFIRHIQSNEPVFIAAINDIKGEAIQAVKPNLRSASA